MRYNRFLLEDAEIPPPPAFSLEGIHLVHTEITEEESVENMAQVHIMEALFFTICELFEIEKIEIQTTAYDFSFLLETKEETEFNSQKGIQSPSLSRKKMKGADTKEISGAVIDLFIDRHKWNIEKSYTTLNI